MIFNFIKKCILKILDIKNQLIWKVQFKKLSAYEVEHLSLILEDKRCLFLIPHADDELLGAYTLLTKNRENFVLFYSGWTGSSENKKIKQVRQDEFISLCEEEKLNYVIAQNWQEDFEKALEKYRINTIFLPSVVDWHEEHRKINVLVKEILEDRTSKYNFIWYQVTVPIWQEKRYIWAMSREEQEKKYIAFNKYYKSQSFMPIKRFRMAEQGVSNKEYASEVFLPISSQLWEKGLSYAHENEAKLNNLRHNINNPIKIQGQANAIYSEFMINKRNK